MIVMMKNFARITLCGLALLGADLVQAQISVDRVEANKEEISFRDSLKATEAAEAEYFSLARYKAERAAIRRERNKLEITTGVQGSLTSYSDSWIATSGGDNTISLAAIFDLKHSFKKNRFSIETRAIAKFGYNRMKVEYQDRPSEGVWFKNQDEFEISTAPKFDMSSKNWAYGAIVKFRSQFASGYKSRTEQLEEHRKSCFMTPGYLDVSLGFTYTCPKPKFPISINFSPFALNATFAESDRIRRDNGYNYGIEDPDKTSRYEGGSSLQVDFDRKFGKSEFLRYRTMLYTFYGWLTNFGVDNKISDYTAYKIAYQKWSEGDKNIKDKPRLPVHPIVRWTNTIDIRATKYLSTQINFELYYNRSQNLSVMTKTLLSVGLTYTFKNK